MADVAHALVRRAAHATKAHFNDDANSADDLLKQTVLAGGMILGLTMLLYVLIISAVRAILTLSLSRTNIE